MAARRSRQQDIATGTEEQQRAGERTAVEGHSVADDAEQIREIQRGQHDAPTDDEEVQIQELEAQIRDRVKNVMTDVEREQARLQSEMRQSAADREQSADQQRANAGEFQKFYGLNKAYDRGAVDEMLAITNESVEFQRQQQRRTEQASAELQQQMLSAVRRLSDAFDGQRTSSPADAHAADRRPVRQLELPPRIIDLARKTHPDGRESRIVMVPISRIDLGDNPIQGGWHPGKRSVHGASYEEMSAAMCAFQERILPQLLDGASPRQLADEDPATKSGLVDWTSAEQLLSEFVTGGDVICVEAAADGRMLVNGGRHRIQVAQDLGFTHVPARIIE